MTRLLIDTNVFLHARGRAHSYREPCRAVLRAAASGSIRLEASVEVVQEFAHVLVRRGVDRSSPVAQAQEVSAQCLMHAFDEDVLVQALALVADHPTLGMRDAVHAATALGTDIAQVISADRVIDGVEGITRVDPLDTERPGSRQGAQSTCEGRDVAGIVHAPAHAATRSTSRRSAVHEWL